MDKPLKAGLSITGGFLLYNEKALRKTAVLLF